MKKQRLIELQEKSENGNAELKDVVEILSELFLTQSQYNKELLASIGDLSAKVNKLQTKINDIAKYTTNEPLAQLLVSNFEEFEKELTPSEGKLMIKKVKSFHDSFNLIPRKKE